MDRKIILEKLYDKYIAPTKPARAQFIGVEIEMPIVNLNGTAVDFSVVHQLTAAFIEKFSFRAAGYDDEGNIFSAQSPVNGDIFSYDCSYNNLELSFGKEMDLTVIDERFKAYYSYIQAFFAPYRYTLTGMGVNPNRKVNCNIPIENGRYRMLFHHLHSYPKYKLPMYFHHYPEFGTFSSASQVQLDVEYPRLAQTLNVFTKLEPIKALLFSNSVLLGEDSNLLCCRDMFWENSTHGINPHNIGMYDCEFSSAEDILRYIETAGIYCTERNGKYINFAPIPVTEYFSKKEIQGEYFDNGKYVDISFAPEITDLQYLRTFKFEDLTFRGTVEFRSVCCQPIADVMAAAAFHIGLMNRIDALEVILNRDTVLYHQGYTAVELRKLLVQRRLPEFVDKDALDRLITDILDLSRDGLRERNRGEERFLLPLYQRAATRTNPAKRMLELLEQGTPLNDIIKEYARIG